MTNNELFDKHVKDLLGDYSPPVHPRIWEQIAAERDKRKPAGFWIRILNNRNLLILAASLLLCGGTGAWFWINHTSNPQPLATQKPAQQNSTQAGTNNPSTNNPANNSTLSDNVTPIAADPAGNPPAVADNNRPGATRNQPAPATDAAASSSDNSNIASRFTDASETLTGSLKKARTKGATRVNTIPATATADPMANSLTDEDFPVGGTLLGRLNYIAERIAARKIAAGSPEKRNPAFYLPDCPALEKNASGNKKYLEVYAGPDYAFRSFRDTGNSVYLQKRKESTKFSSAYSAGIRYTRVFKNSMSVRAGVNYSQINEKFTYVQGNLVQVTYIIDANGDTTGSYVTTGSRYKTTHNKYHSIDMPVMVGYEFGNGRLHANISAGPVINIYSWQKGEVLDTALKPVTITTGKGSTPYQFKTNAGLGFMGSVSVYYKLNDHIHIMAEPYYRYNFSQMNKENLTLKQKFNSAGIRVGVRVDLP